MAALRTPPNRYSVAQEDSSESDITKLDPDSPLNYIGRRTKRPRNDEEGKSTNDSSLKAELLAMLSDWKKDHDLVLNKLCTSIEELKQQNASIQSTNDELEKSLKFMSLQYEDMKTKMLNLERERKENLTYIANLESKIDDIQKSLKFTAIEFRNLPQQVKQETQRDLCDVVQKTCDTLNVPIQTSDIKDIFRIRNKAGVSTVVTDLTSVLTKNKILNAVKEFNQINPNNKLSTSTIGFQGPVTPIYISESLSNKDRKLFAMTREAAKTLGYKYCWTKRGKIFIRKAESAVRLEIKKEEDLVTLKNTSA